MRKGRPHGPTIARVRSKKRPAFLWSCFCFYLFLITAAVEAQMRKGRPHGPTI